MEAIVAAVIIFAGLAMVSSSIDRVLKALCALSCVFYVVLPKDKREEADKLIKKITKGS